MGLNSFNSITNKLIMWRKIDIDIYLEIKDLFNHNNYVSVLSSFEYMTLFEMKLYNIATPYLMVILVTTRNVLFKYLFQFI